MVEAVLAGESMRAVANRFGVSLSHVQRWVTRARDSETTEVDWTDRAPGARRSLRRTSASMEQRILRLRRDLRERSDLGEYGAAAIRRALETQRASSPKLQKLPVPSLRTIGRILERHGALDGRRRMRRTAPPRGWYLSDLATGEVELDSFDIVEDLVIRGGVDVNVLTGISLHGGLAAAWPRSQITAKNTVDSLVEHWREFGLPGYAKFDNDTVFQGAHQWPDSFGRVTRLCLGLGVTPVFAPPRETGFQADIESFNGRWQAKVWRRFEFADLKEVAAQSDRFLAALRDRVSARIGEAPSRIPFPERWRIDLQTPLRGQVIFLRRTDARGSVKVLGHSWTTSEVWCNRLVRVEVDLTRGELRTFALRRRSPNEQPQLSRHDYQPPRRRFQE
jgi:hypothetical protein